MAQRDLVLCSNDCSSTSHWSVCRRDFESRDPGEVYHHLCGRKSTEFKFLCCPLWGLHVLPDPGRGSNGQDLSRFRDGKRSSLGLSSGGSGHLPSQHSCHQQIDRPEENLCLCGIDYFLLYIGWTDLWVCPYHHLMNYDQSI